MSAQPAIPSPEDLLAHAGFIRAVARGMLHDPQGADDVVQETVLAALDAPPPRGALRAWLAGIARNLSRSTLRSEGRRAARELAAARPERQPSAVDVAARLELQRHLVEAVQALAEPFRTAIVLRYFEGLRPSEIADRIGVPAATARTRIHRGLALLRAHFDHAHGGDRRAWTLALAPLAAIRKPIAGTTTTLLAAGGVMTIQKAAIAVVIAAVLAVAIMSVGGAPGNDRPGDPGGAIEVISTSSSLEGAAREDGAFPAGAATPGAPDRDLDVFGLILDPNGEPLEGALVATFRDPWGGDAILHPATLDDSVSGPTDRSAADGSFRVRLARGEVVDLRVTAEGLGERCVNQCQAGERVVVSFAAGAGIEVAARDEGGSPVAGARITIWSGRGPDSPLTAGSGATGEDGEALIAGLPPGRATVLLIHDDFATPETVAVIVPTSGRTRAEFVLERGRTVRGRVTDAATSEPIARALLSESPLPLRTVVTGEDGAYVFENWGGAFGDRVYVAAPGYARTAGRLPATGEALNFALTRGDEVIGRVLGATGDPVAAARVATGATFGAVTGIDGRFRATGLRRGAGIHALVIRALGHATLIRTVEPAPDRPGVIDLGDVVLSESRAVEGVVIGPGGEPLPQVAVGLWREIDTGGKRPFIAQERRRTDDLGRFRFRDIAPGDYTIAARPEWTRGVSLETVVLPGKDVIGIEVRIAVPRVAREGSLTVRVLDPDRRPVKGVRVAVRAPGAPSEWPTAWTDDDGRARLTGLAVRVSIEIEPASDPARSLRKETREVDACGEEIEVVLVEQQVIRGVVLAPNGGPLAGMRVRAVPAGQVREVSQGVTNGEGRFEVPLPPNTTVDLVVDGVRLDRNQITARLPVYGEVCDIAAGAGEVTIHVATQVMDRALVVRVEDPEGRPVVGARVSILGRGFRGASGTTGADGRFRASGLPPRDVQCHVRRAEAPGLLETHVRPQALVVEPVGQEVVLRFLEGAELIGVVRDSTGRAVPGATVLICLHGEYMGSVRTDAEGRFHARGLPGKRYTLSAVAVLPERRQTNARRENVVPGTGEIEIRFDVPVPVK